MCIILYHEHSQHMLLLIEASAIIYTSQPCDVSHMPLVVVWCSILPSPGNIWVLSSSFGVAFWIIPLAFLFGWDLIPPWIRRYPMHLISCCIKKDFLKFTLKPASCTRLQTVCKTLKTSKYSLSIYLPSNRHSEYCCHFFRSIGSLLHYIWINITGIQVS